MCVSPKIARNVSGTLTTNEDVPRLLYSRVRAVSARDEGVRSKFSVSTLTRGRIDRPKIGPDPGRRVAWTTPRRPLPVGQVQVSPGRAQRRPGKMGMRPTGALKGRNKRGEIVSPFQGLRLTRGQFEPRASARLAGTRRALPWATLFLPLQGKRFQIVRASPGGTDNPWVVRVPQAQEVV